jgi:VCBS repeat protein
VEREAVADPDPQKGTAARPRTEQGGRWFRENIPAPHGSQALSWGDFENDGSDELLAGWPLQVFKRESSGRWVELNSNLKLPRSQRALAIDLNHDGLADIVSERGNAVTLLWNKTRLPWVRHVIASGFRNQTALPGDFGRPGQPDVISGDIENDHRLFLFSAPDWKPTLLISGIRVIQSAALDVDGDGDLDFIGAQYHPGPVFWLERPPCPLQDPWKYHLIDDSRQGGIDGVHGLALADMDGDSRSDLVAASGWTSGNFPDSIVWFRIPQDVRQAKSRQRFVLADRDAPGFNHYPSTGDVNGDGRGDVASAAKAGPRGNWFAWWEHPASRPTEPWKKHLISADQPGATNILIVDLNGDGKPDFLGSRGHGKGVVWFEAPNWTLHEIDNTLVGTHGLAAVDIDGDGDIDFATCAKDSGLLAWFENDGSGRFTEHRIHEDQSICEIRLIDMNGDGTLDILVAAQESKNVVWYENRLRPQANALH